MSWPLSQDYNEAIQSPATNFVDNELRLGIAACNALGLPMPRSGNFADVYEVRCPDGTRWAVKCFTRETPELRERYQEISRHLQQARLPFMVDFTYLDQGIRVGGHWYPVLKMQWVEGFTFNQFVRQCLDKPTILDALLHLWGRMGRQLREAEVAHGDLQHGNIMLVPATKAKSLEIKLIDYDGMYVPALRGRGSGELGHPAYQHPQRLREVTYSQEVDRFPLLLVAAALRALAFEGAPLWQKYDNADNLLFREADLRDPDQSSLFRELRQHHDPTTAALASALRKGLAGGVESARLLEEVLSEAPPTPPPPLAARSSVIAQPTPTPLRPPLPVVAPAQGPPPLRLSSPVRVFSAAGTPPPPYQTTPPPRRGRRIAKRVRPEESTSAPEINSAGTEVLRTRVGVCVAVGVTAFAVLVGGVTAAIYLAKQDRSDAALAQSRPDRTVRDAGKPTETMKDIPRDKFPADHPSGESTPPVRDDAAPEVKKADSRPALPDAAALAAAEKEAAELYRAEYAKRATEDVVALANRMLKDGLEPSAKPAACFFLLREARDLAAKVGDLPLALRAAGEMANHFTVDVRTMKAEALALASRKAAKLDAHRNVILFALLAAEEAEEEDDYDAAQQFVNAAQASADATGRADLVSGVQERAGEIEALREAFKPFANAVRILASRPDNTDANLAVGRFYSLAKADWDRGLLFLRAGSDAKLRALAQSDPAAPSDAAAMERLGDQYRSLGETEISREKSHLLYRACYWYEQAEGKYTEPARTRMARKRAVLEGTLPASRPVVLHARYGAVGGWADVTEKMRSLVLLSPGQRLAFKGGSNELGIGDPCFGEHKTLVVVYRYRGGVYVSTTGDADTANVPALPGPAIMPPGRPEAGQELALLCARYGADGTFATGTERAQVLVKGATFAIRPGDLRLGDPFFGRHKTLILVYRYRGRIYLSTTGEDQAVAIDAAPGEP